MQKNSSDLFEILAQSTKPNFKGFSDAQAAYDNAEPNDEYEPEITTEMKEANKAYLFSMKLAIDGLSKQMEIYRKYNKSEIADLIENDIDEIATEVSRRELKFLC